LMQLTGRLDLIPALILATLVWAIAAAPAILANGIYIKLHPAIIAMHTIGWLVKLALISSVASYLLRL